MANKKLIATIVSSREKGLRRREEGWTMSSQKTISLQRNHGGGRDKLTNVDGDFPTCMRNGRNNNADETKNGRPERKRRRTTQASHHWWRCSAVSEKNREG